MTDKATFFSALRQDMPDRIRALLSGLAVLGLLTAGAGVGWLLVDVVTSAEPDRGVLTCYDGAGLPISESVVLGSLILFRDRYTFRDDRGYLQTKEGDVLSGCIYKQED